MQPSVEVLAVVVLAAVPLGIVALSPELEELLSRAPTTKIAAKATTTAIGKAIRSFLYRRGLPLESSGPDGSGPWSDGGMPMHRYRLVGLRATVEITPGASSGLRAEVGFPKRAGPTFGWPKSGLAVLPRVG